MYGIDSEAHQRCLEYGGTTVAVLGSGLNVIYPPENHKLYQQILESSGAIISEYDPETKPQLWTFPQRNRIVAGLASLGVLIIEAGERSGSLITARLAREQGKKVFAVPGPITSSVSAGTNLLLKNHQAKMVLSAEDILGKRITTPSLFASSQLSPIEKKIFKALQREPLTVDELAQGIGKNIIETGKALTMMSLKGFVTESVGKYYLVPNASSLS
jgi:DNA processing protein